MRKDYFNQRMHSILGRRQVAIGAIVLTSVLFSIRLTAQLATTKLEGSICRASGSSASGTVQVSWPAFTRPANQAIAAGHLSAAIGARAFVSLKLIANAGATRRGSYYTAVYHLSDGTVQTDYWVVPAAAVASIGSVRFHLEPSNIAVPSVCRAHVDRAVRNLDSASLPPMGDAMSSSLTLSADQTLTKQAVNHSDADRIAAAPVPPGKSKMTRRVTVHTLSAGPTFTFVGPAGNIQSAINSVSAAGGGTVELQPGTYDGFSTLTSNVTVKCTAWMGCVLNYSVPLTLGTSFGFTSNAGLDGLVFNFQGNDAGLTLNGFRGSLFNLWVENTGRANALTLTATAPHNNFYNNRLPWIMITGAQNGLVLDGHTNLTACGGPQVPFGGAVYGNSFGQIFAGTSSSPVTGTAVNFVGGADSNDFKQVFLTTGPSDDSSALVFNSYCKTRYADVDFNHFSHLSIDALKGGYKGPMITANFSRGVIDYFAAGANSSQSNVISRTANTNWTIGWESTSDLTAYSQPFIETHGADIQGTLGLSNRNAATSSLNQVPPCLNLNGQEWTGSASAPSKWQICSAESPVGVPTWELISFNFSGQSKNIGVQIPNKLIIARGTGSSFLYSSVSTHNVPFALPNNPAGGTLALTSQLPLSGTTGTIGGSRLLAGQCSSGTVRVIGATPSMAVEATPVTYPGNAFVWKAWVNAPNAVTVTVCAQLAAEGTPTPSVYNVRVLQ